MKELLRSIDIVVIIPLLHFNVLQGVNWMLWPSALSGHKLLRMMLNSENAPHNRIVIWGVLNGLGTLFSTMRNGMMKIKKRRNCHCNCNCNCK